MLRESWSGLTCEECIQFRSLCGAAPSEASRQVVNGAPDEGINSPLRLTRVMVQRPRKRSLAGGWRWSSR